MKSKRAEEIKQSLLDQYYAKQRALAEARKPKAEVVEFPPKLSEQELARRQAIIDWHWQMMLDEKARLREEAERRSFNKAPGDPDWNL